jgi:hypothetical protein
MNSCRQPQGLDHLAQQCCECRLLFGRQAGGDHLLVQPGHLGRTLEQHLPSARQVHGVDPAVPRVRSSLGQTPRLEVVEEADHAARRDAEDLTHRLLRLALVPRQVPEEGDVARLEIERLKRFGKTTRALEAGLREKKAERPTLDRLRLPLRRLGPPTAGSQGAAARWPSRVGDVSHSRQL